MEDGSIVDVVLLHHVRGSCVHQGGEQRRSAPARDQDFARAFARPHRRGELLQNADWLRVAARQGASHPVQEQILGSIDHCAGKLFKAETG
jgi:hypothetical protein